MNRKLAPCVAIVGPARAGKTTLLNQLDAQLQSQIESVLVIKGSPDGEGRYLFHAPGLRGDSDFKREHRGYWGEFTFERICEWIQHARRNLRLALLDFGGKHNPENDRVLSLCTHYIVLSRADDPVGRRSWAQVCERNNLTRIASLTSVGKEETPRITGYSPYLRARFNYEARPGDSVNDGVLKALSRRLCRLSVEKKKAPFISLWRADRWTESMIGDVGGLASAIQRRAARNKTVVLGGRAPVWAYLSALRCALETNSGAQVLIFDPKLPEGLVEIPLAPAAGDFPQGVLSLEWDQLPDPISRLTFNLAAIDKILPPTVAQNLAASPWGLPTPLPAAVGLNGPVPMWLFAAYVRWLHHAGVRRISSWDMSLGKFVDIWT